MRIVLRALLQKMKSDANAKFFFDIYLNIHSRQKKAKDKAKNFFDVCYLIFDIL